MSPHTHGMEYIDTHSSTFKSLVFIEKKINSESGENYSSSPGFKTLKKI